MTARGRASALCAVDDVTFCSSVAPCCMDGTRAGRLGLVASWEKSMALLWLMDAAVLGRESVAFARGLGLVAGAALMELEGGVAC